MTMTAKGLAKLLEECGELSQVAAKKLAYYSTDKHPDGAGSLDLRMQDEMGDVLAAIAFVAGKFGLDWEAITSRKAIKLDRFVRWDLDPNDAPHYWRGDSPDSAVTKPLVSKSD